MNSPIPESLKPAIRSVIASYRESFDPKNPPDPLAIAAQHEDLMPFLLAPLLIEDFWNCLQFGQDIEAERFLNRYEQVEADDEFKLHLLAIELSTSRAAVVGKFDPESAIERFPELEKEITSRFPDLEGLRRTVHEARANSDYRGPTLKLGAPPGRPWAGGSLYENQGVNMVEDFKLHRPISVESGQKIIWKATQTNMGRQVAVLERRKPQPGDSQNDAKLRRSMKSKETLIREALLMAKLDRQTIPPVYSIRNVPGEEPVLAEKFIEGVTWRRLLLDQRQSPADRSESGQRKHLRINLSILRLICDALAYAHTIYEVVHLDIKPENVMIGPAMVGDHGEVYLIDWGLAIQAGIKKRDDLPKEIEHWSELEKEDVAPGTLEFSPPEMRSQQHEMYSPRTDVFQLGAVLYELLTTEPPYKRDPVTGEANPDPILPPRQRTPHRYVPEDLVSIWEKACALDPQHRHANAQEFGKAIDGYQKIANAEDAADDARRRLTELETADAGATSTRATRLKVMPALIEIANVFKTSATAWNDSPEVRSESVSLQRIRRDEVTTRVKLAKLAEAIGDYGSAQSQYEEATRVMGANKIEFAVLAAKMKSKDQRTRFMVKAAWALGAVSVVLGMVAWRFQVAHERGKAALAIIEADRKQQSQRADAETRERHLKDQLLAKEFENQATRSLGQGNTAEAALSYANAHSLDSTPKRLGGWHSALSQCMFFAGSSYRFQPGRAVWTNDNQSFIGTEPLGRGRLLVWDTASGKLTATLPGHPQPEEGGSELTCVRGLAMDRKENVVYSAGLDGVLRRTHLDSRETLTCDPQPTPLTALAVARVPGRNDPLIVTGDHGGNITLWSPELKPLSSFSAVKERIVVLEASSDGEHLAFITTKGPVHLIKANGTPIAELKLDGDAYVLSTLAFSPDGSYLAAGATDGSVPVWRIADGKLQSRRVIHAKGPDGNAVTRQVQWRGTKEIVSAGADGTLAVHDPFTNTPSQKSPPVEVSGSGSRTIFFFALSPDGKRGITGDMARQTTVWDMSDLKPVLRADGLVAGFGLGMTDSRLNFERNLLALAGGDPLCRLRLMNATTLESVAEIREGVPTFNENDPTASIPVLVAWSRDGRHLAAAFQSGDLSVYEVPDDPANPRLLWTKPLAHGEPIRAGVGISVGVTLMGWADDGCLITAGRDHQIKRWTASVSEPLSHRSWDLPLESNLNPEAIPEAMKCMIMGVVEPDGKHIVASPFNNKIYRIEVESEAQPQRIVTGHRGAVGVMDISLDGRRFVTCDADGIVNVWNWVIGGKFIGEPIATQQFTSSLPRRGEDTTPSNVMKRNACVSARFSADGNFVALAKSDLTVSVLDAVTLSPQQSVTMLDSVNGPMPVVMPSFAKDGALITSSYSGETMRWRLNPLAQQITHSTPADSQGVNAKDITFLPEANAWLMRVGAGSHGFIAPLLSDGAPDATKIGLGTRLNKLKGFVPPQNYKPGVDQIGGVARVPGKPWAVFARLTGEAYVIDGKNKSIIASFEPPNKLKAPNLRSMSSTMAVPVVASSTGDVVAIAAMDQPGVHLFETATGKLIRSLTLPDHPQPPPGSAMSRLPRKMNLVRALAFHPTLPQLALVQDDKKLSVWDINTATKLFTTKEGPNVSANQQLAYKPRWSRDHSWRQSARQPAYLECHQRSIETKVRRPHGCSHGNGSRRLQRQQH